MRNIIKSHKGNLLALTVRFISKDETPVISCAPNGNYFSFMSYFNRSKSLAGYHRFHLMAQELIDAALARGGTFYLPYELHATSEQFKKAYPQADHFFERKRYYDPEERFRNALYDKYASGHELN